MSKLILREYTEDDKLEVVELLKRGLTKEFTLERWNWLHHNNMTLGSHIIIAEDDGKIVGTIGAIKKRFTYNSDNFIGERHLDPVVDSSMRGKGIFTKLLNVLNEACNNVAFSYTFPNAASFRGFAKTGYTSIGPIFMPLCQLKFYGVPLKEKLRFLNTGAKLLRSKPTSVERDEFQALKDLKPRAPIDKYALQRDYHYIQWRYVDSPVKQYDLLVSRHGNAVQSACIILKDVNKVSIMDFVEYTDRINLSEYLVAIKNIYGNVPIVVWNNNIYSINKFFVGKSIQNFLVREGSMKMPKEFFEKSHWYITKGEVEAN